MLLQCYSALWLKGCVREVEQWGDGGTTTKRRDLRVKSGSFMITRVSHAWYLRRGAHCVCECVWGGGLEYYICSLSGWSCSVRLQQHCSPHKGRVLHSSANGCGFSALPSRRLNTKTNRSTGVHTLMSCHHNTNTDKCHARRQGKCKDKSILVLGGFSLFRFFMTFGENNLK